MTEPSNGINAASPHAVRKQYESVCDCVFAQGITFSSFTLFHSVEGSPGLSFTQSRPVASSTFAG